MKKLHILFLLFIFSLNVRAQKSEDWTSMFNGKYLDGWKVIGKPAKVQVADSSLRLQMTAYTSRHAFVRSEKQYRNFIFEVDFRRDLNLDSGILFRSIDAPDTAFSSIFGYMVKVDPRPARRWTGGIFVDYGNGHEWLQTLENNEGGRNAEHAGGEWNRLRIEAIGDHIKVWLNDVPTANILDNRYKKGYVGFKIHYLLHDKAQEGLMIAFRNPRIITRSVKKYARPISLPLQDTRGLSNINYFRR
jgi:hypothetical protein